MVGAAGDEIAGIHGHHRGGELDQLGHAVLHVVGIVIVAQLAVVPEAHDQVVGVGDLVGGGDAGPDRREGVEGFAEPAGERARRPGAAALLARGDVDHRGIAEHRALPILGLHHLGRALDHQRQLGLVHEHPRHRELGQHDGIAGADHRVRVLHEHVERARLALRVLPIIGDAGEDLAGARQRRPQPHFIERQGIGIAREFFQRRAQGIEIVDDALHGQLRRVAFLHRRRNIDHAAIGQDAGHDVGAGRRLKERKLHEQPPAPRRTSRTPEFPLFRLATQPARLSGGALRRSSRAARDISRRPRSAPARSASPW